MLAVPYLTARTDRGTDACRCDLARIGQVMVAGTHGEAEGGSSRVDEPVDVDQLQALVAAERQRRGLSLRAAAEEADVPFNTLARVEKGHLPDLANFRRIVSWLGLSPERFFEPSQLRFETTPDVIAHHLARDPHLPEAAADRIAGLVRDLYANLATPRQDVRVHLRASSTFKPTAARALGDLLDTMQQALTSRETGRGEA